MQNVTIFDDDEHCKIVPTQCQPVNLLEAEFRNNICHGEGSRMHVFANTGLLFDTSFTMLFDSLQIIKDDPVL